MQAGKYDDLAKSILDNVGGTGNVASVTHCITRLRLKLRDEGKANTEVIEKLPGVIKVMLANGQYQVVVGNKIEDVYDSFLRISGLTGGGEVAAGDDAEPNEKKTAGSIIIDLVSGIFGPTLGVLCAAGVAKGLLGLFAFIWPAFASDGAYQVLYTVADGFFYYLPVVLGVTAAEKFGMNKYTGMALGFALVYPTMVALTGGEVLGSVNLGVLGTFSWYSTFFGIPIIMPASGYTSSVIPIVLMTWFGSKVEKWAKSWMPQAIRMFMVPMVTLVVTVVAGYLVIGPVATLITNLLQSVFEAIVQIPVVGAPLLTAIIGGTWLILVIFGFHWALTPLAIVNHATLHYDYLQPGMIPSTFCMGAVLFAMYLKNKDEKFREICLPAMVSAFFFGVTEPAIYGVALPNKKAFVNVCIASTVGGLFMGLLGAKTFMFGGMGVFSWLAFIDSNGVLGAGVSNMIIAIVVSLASSVLAFALEFITYKPQESEA